MSELSTLKNLIKENRLFREIDFNQAGVDEWLDTRDGEAFDECWVSSFEEVEEVCDGSLLDNQIEEINTIREMAFKYVYGLSENGELSGYVSDDFELLAKFIISKSNNSWLEKLLNTYLDGCFPIA